MKKINRIGTVVVSSVLLSAVAKADEDVTNRFTFSARFGLNISAKFKGVNPSRHTPDGFRYNYDDGYVLNDFSDSFGGLTSNWGYDDSSQQVNSQNNTILMSRTSPGANTSRSFDDDPNMGAELAYNHQIGKTGNVRFGFEIAGNYLNLGLRDKSDSTGFRVTDAYGYTPGTTPPTSPDPQTGLPFQGTFSGHNFLLFTNIVSSVTNAATLNDNNKFNGDLWGIRLGPTMEFPISERVNVAVGAGFALGFLDSEVSWKQTTTVAGANPHTTRGSGQDFDVLWGGYFGGNISYQFAEDWSLAGGVQFQSLGKYKHSFDGRKVELDLRKSLFVTIGVGYQF